MLPHPPIHPPARGRVAFAVGALLIALHGDVHAARLKRMLSGTTTSTANGTVTVTLPSVDTTKSFLVFQARHDGNRPVVAEIGGRIASATSLEFIRVTDEGSPATVTIQWYVAEFASGVSVQRGSVAQSTTTVNATITAVSAVSQAFVLWSKTPASTDAGYSGDDPIVGELTSTTNLQFRATSANAAHTIYWQVVEFTSAADIAVQKGSITAMTGTTTSVTATLSPAVDTGRTFVLAGYRLNTTASSIGAGMIRARLTDGTTVTIDRAILGNTDVSTASAWTTGLTHTAGSGSNRLLVFAVGYEDQTDDPGVSSVTYGGRSLTRIAGTVAGSGGVYNRTELWYLNESNLAAASGNTFSVTWTVGSPDYPLYAATVFANVNQSTPIAASNTNSTTSSSPNPLTASVTTVARGMAVASVIAGNDGSYSWGSGWTEGTDQTSGTTVTASTAQALQTTTGTDTASATHSGPNRQALVTAVLNPTVDVDVPEIVWHAIELKDGSKVQHGTASFASSAAQATAALSPAVRLGATLALASTQAVGGQSLGRTYYTGDDVVGAGAATLSLAATTLTLDRTSTAGASDVGWFTVQFVPRRVMVSP